MTTHKFKFWGITLFFTIFLDVIPSLGFISIGNISITTIQIPTIISAIILGPMYGSFTAAVFGLISLFHAMSRDATSVDVLFLNPLISILPRICIALVTGHLFKLINKLAKGKYRAFSAAVCSLIGSLTNTILIFAALYFVYPNELMHIYGISDTAQLWKVLSRNICHNGMIEAAFCTVTCTVIVLILHRLAQKKHWTL